VSTILKYQKILAKKFGDCTKVDVWHVTVHKNISPGGLTPNLSWRDAEAQDFIKVTGADFREGNGEAYYAGGADFISMPHFDAFKDSDCFYATSFHELGHWTGHKDRLDRNLRNRFGRQAFTGWIGRLSMLHSSFFRAWRRSPSCYSGSPYRKPNRGSELAEDAADGRISRVAESKPPSSGRLVMALMATVLVATGVLVLAWVLVLIINLAPLATHASHSIDVGLLTRHISWVSGTTIAAIVIFVATYLVIAIGKLPVIS
jgi:hypothetical protein